MYEYFEHEILTVEELMEVMYIGKNTAYQLLQSGEIRAFRIGRVWKIPKDAVREYMGRMVGRKSLTKDDEE